MQLFGHCHNSKWPIAVEKKPLSIQILWRAFLKELSWHRLPSPIPKVSLSSSWQREWMSLVIMMKILGHIYDIGLYLNDNRGVWSSGLLCNASHTCSFYWFWTLGWEQLQMIALLLWHSVILPWGCSAGITVEGQVAKVPFFTGLTCCLW